MADGFVYTTHADQARTNSLEGHDRSDLGVFENKEQAIAQGRGEAHRRETEHVIHTKDGTVGERNPYGHGPAGRPR